MVRYIGRWKKGIQTTLNSALIIFQVKVLNNHELVRDSRTVLNRLNPAKGDVGSSFELSWNANSTSDPCLINTCSEVQTCEHDSSDRGYKCKCNDLTFNGWGDNGPEVKTIKMTEQLIEDPSTKAYSNRTICVPLHQSSDKPTGIRLKSARNSSNNDVFPYAIIYEFFKTKFWFQL